MTTQQAKTSESGKKVSGRQKREGACFAEEFQIWTGVCEGGAGGGRTSLGEENYAGGLRIRLSRGPSSGEINGGLSFKKDWDEAGENNGGPWEKG